MTIYRRLKKVGLARSARPGFDQWLAERTRRDGNCLRWTRAHSSRGFPITYRNRQGVTVHRVVWEHAHGPIPVGTEIRHVPHCPHRDCVQLEHLHPVSTTAHIADRVQNGAFAHGERHWNAKLTEPEVRAILASHQTNDVLAARFGVTPGNIRAIRTGRTWRQLQR